MAARKPARLFVPLPGFIRNCIYGSQSLMAATATLLIDAGVDLRKVRSAQKLGGWLQQLLSH
ncbi:MAG: hypothetical protein IPO77_07965 [Acidobacteria bacterium]|nr:hypothetical protein [Acidobacteriota bacterium]